MGFYEEHCTYLKPMIGWFIFSAILTSYNKKLLGTDEMHFPCPLLLTSMHFGSQWIFSYVTTSLYPDANGTAVITNMSWSNFLCVSVPCGLVTCLDVALSNLAIVRISITFSTMIKSSSPIFVVASAFILGIEKLRYSLICVVLLICFGEYLTVLGEVHYDRIGFFLCLAAAVFSGLRWTVMQSILHRLDPPLKSAIATMRILVPSMFFFMVLFALIIERPWDTLSPSSGSPYFKDFQSGVTTFALGLIGSVIAIMMILCEFYLIMKSNALIMMIGGVTKEMLMILVGVFAFGDKLNAINVSGCIIVFFGVGLFKYSHYKQKMEEHKQAEGKIKIEYKPFELKMKKFVQNILISDGPMDSSSNEIDIFLTETHELELENQYDENGNIEFGGLENSNRIDRLRIT